MDADPSAQQPKQSGLAHARRILVLGPPGSGKTTLSKALARDLKLPLCHLDDLYWMRGWARVSAAAFAAAQGDIVAGDAWIIDGMHLPTLDLRLARADAVVLLDVRPVVAALGFATRGLHRLLGERTSLPARIRAASDRGRARPDVGLLVRILRFRSTTRPVVEALLARHPRVLLLKFRSRGDARRHLQGVRSHEDPVPGTAARPELFQRRASPAGVPGR